jgi:MYXO-CTERM domain-containing protein
MNHTITAPILALALFALAAPARANMGYDEPEEICDGDEVCDPCHYGAYTGVCIDAYGCLEADDDDSAEEDCYLQCVTNANHEDLDQCPDADLPSCECSGAGAAGASALPAVVLIVGLIWARYRRRGGS